MIYESKGLPTTHGRIGFSIFLFILFSVISGRLFLKRTSVLGKKLKRSHHKYIAIISLILLGFQIINGLLTFVL
jgi:hypothetical protein